MFAASTNGFWWYMPSLMTGLFQVEASSGSHPVSRHRICACFLRKVARKASSMRTKPSWMNCTQLRAAQSGRRIAIGGHVSSFTIGQHEWPALLAGLAIDLEDAKRPASCSIDDDQRKKAEAILKANILMTGCKLAKSHYARQPACALAQARTASIAWRVSLRSSQRPIPDPKAQRAMT